MSALGNAVSDETEPQSGAIAGQVVAGRYRLLSEIGKGGMGAVWRAVVEDAVPPSSRRTARGFGQVEEVALKIILPARLDGPSGSRELALGRFAREAGALSRLRSPHVVTLHDHGTDGDFVYIAMELLHGEPLSARLKRIGKLESDAVVRLFAHMTRAFGLAHQHGIIHRDVKPGNIFLASSRFGASDVAKVLDFGLVKSVGSPLVTLDVNTRSGSLLGTPHYMSPEQARGLSDVDHRADLWSLGVIAFECICGLKPFRGRGLAKVLGHIVSGHAPVPSEHASVPRGFDQWFARAVHPSPDRRFQSAFELMEELREILVDGALSARLARRSRLDAESQQSTDTVLDLPLTVATRGGGPPLSFEGREVELEAAERVIDAGTRTLGIVGPSGVGKTRFARELLRRWRSARQLPNVAAWLEDADGAPWTWLELAAALEMDGVGENAALDVARALRALGRGAVLLDSADASGQLLAQSLAGWLVAAPDVTFVYTAKVPLRIEGEVIIELSPFPIPAIGNGGLGELARHPAGAIFAAHAARHGPGFLGLDVASAELVKLMALSGGFPLALQLAGAVVGRLSAEELAESLESATRLSGATLTMGSDAILERAVAWSVATLSFAERSALCQLSVFRDGFTLDAAEAVVDGEWRHFRRPYEVVLELAERGYLQQEEPLTGDPRYRMPAALRHYAASLRVAKPDVVDPEAACVDARHSAYFESFVSPPVVGALRRRGGLVRRIRLGHEAQNLRVALEQATRSGETRRRAPLAYALATVLDCERASWTAATLLGDVRSGGGLGVLESVLFDLARADALFKIQCFELSRDAFESAHASASRLDDAASRTKALVGVCRCYLALGDAHRAHAACVEALAAAAADDAGRGDANFALAALSLHLERYSEAIQASEDALRAARTSGDRRSEARTLLLVGEALAEAGDEPAAARAFEAAHVLFGEMGERLEQSRALAWLGEVQGRHDRALAIRTLERAAARARELGSATTEGLHLALWALIQLEGGGAQRASRGLYRAEELLALDVTSESRLVLALCRAWTALYASDQASFWRELGAAENLVRESGVRLRSRGGLALSRLRKTMNG